jgi:argininosuccinate lyase
MTLWGGRFTQKLDPSAEVFNRSLSFDQRLAREDVAGSSAWAGALGRAGILTREETKQIQTGLKTIAAEIESGQFVLSGTDEDIHTAVERHLGELIGPVAGKLHTGRSRNDQVATDLRMWLMNTLPKLDAAMAGLQASLLNRALSDLAVLMPGYTHLQRAQPVLLSHWWLSHFWPLQRDRERFAQLRMRTAVLPLGSGALSGTPYPIDRSALAKALGFTSVSPNSIDAVSDRDFAAEFLFDATMTAVHLSRLSEDMVLFTSSEFGFFSLSDAFATGSSLMPQKKNPDVFELGRGKAGTMLGLLSGLLATLKGLPSGYDKDLQEDKQPVFAAADTLFAVLPVFAGAFGSLAIHPERMRAAIDGGMMATDLADYLVAKGVPFREAHLQVGKTVQAAASKGVPLDGLSPEEFQALGPYDSDVYAVFDPELSVAKRTAEGGTSRQAVQHQILQAKNALNHAFNSYKGEKHEYGSVS